MHTVESLQKDLGRLGVDPSGALLVHVSCKTIGEVDGRGDAVLDALSAHMAGGLLMLPGHTWAAVNDTHPVMDARTTPSCVGVLPELFRRRPGVCRSLHPTHSLCGLGRGAGRFLAGDERADTPCGFGTAYRRLYEQRGQILLIGVGFNRNTYIHGVEEWYDVPNRLEEKLKPLFVMDFGGVTRFTPQHRHSYNSETGPFRAEAAMIAAGAATQGRLGDADCLLCDARKLSDGLGEMIRAGAFDSR